MAPLFSIVIPVYNVAPYLRECLDSVLAQYATDGENEFDGVHRDFFANIHDMEDVRMLDAMYACTYVDILVKAFEKDAETARERSRRLVNEGPGMHLRYENWLCIAALRAAMRPHLKICM